MFNIRGLCRYFRCDQHVVGGGLERDGDVEQRPEGGVSGVAAIEAEDELVEVGSQMLATQPVVDPERPTFEVSSPLTMWLL
jgi:hypothetical protein